MQGMWGRRVLIGSLLAGSMPAGTAQAQTFDPRDLVGPTLGMRTLVIVGASRLHEPSCSRSVPDSSQ